MLPVWYFPYVLNYHHSSKKKRHGLLLRIQSSQGDFGYSDLHPWVELGDLSLDEILSVLKSQPLHKGKSPRQLSESLSNALLFSSERPLMETWLREGGLRKLEKEKQNKKNQELLSHIDEVSQELGVEKEVYQNPTESRDIHRKFDFVPNQPVVKLKIGFALSKEIEFLNHMSVCFPQVTWRLDGNLRLSEEAWAWFWSQLNSHSRSLIEYVEDPFVFHEESWFQWNRQVCLASDFAVKEDQWENQNFLDRLLEKNFLSFVVWKPSRQSSVTLEKVLSCCPFLKISVTSQLGHSLDTFWSAWSYSKLQKPQGSRLSSAPGLFHQNLLQESTPFFGLKDFSSLGSVQYLDKIMSAYSWLEGGFVSESQ
jgi:o-succinylbenzoate synthase